MLAEAVAVTSAVGGGSVFSALPHPLLRHCCRCVALLLQSHNAIIGMWASGYVRSFNMTSVGMGNHYSVLIVVGKARE